MTPHPRKLDQEVRLFRLRHRVARFSALFYLALAVRGAEPPIIPIGLDAYRQWAGWARQRIGARAYMRSTYDRAGGNEGADASHFLRQSADDRNVTLEVEGSGVLCFARFNHWHGSPWHFIVDGVDHVVRETSTADPDHPAPGSVFIPAEAFPPPLAVTWAATQGADLSWAPIPFERSFEMAYERTHYGTGYYIYHQYVGGAKLSRPIQAWTGGPADAADVVDLLSRAGSDLSPPGAVGVEGVVDMLPAGETRVLTRLTNGPGLIRKLRFLIPQDQSGAFARARLRVTWDGRAQPSVDAPAALFFGAGTLYNRDGREYLVKAFPSFIRYGGGSVELACFFPMPFFRSATFELIAPADAALEQVRWTVAREKLDDPPSAVGYFHATYADHAHPERGRDLVLLDTRRTEGGGDWSGSFVGTSWIFSDQANLGTLEGDPRFFFDDSQTPQAQGTGTEEWGGGGDYWGGRNMTLPFAGHPTGAPGPREARSADDKIESAYRFLLGDLMPFGKNALIRLEHGGENQSTEHYQTVTYWYGAPACSLVKTDELRPADPASCRAHEYRAPGAPNRYEVVSRYEWGVDTIPGDPRAAGGTNGAPVVIYPAEPDFGRKLAGFSEFTLKLNPTNLGVMLRRKLDYSFPNQRAEVFVADALGSLDWKPAGVWYLAGGNTCVYSNPKEELGAAEHKAETSNRRFRDDEFLIARELTEGRSSIRVRVKFTRVDRPLFPGDPLPEQAWTEFRYDAYCFVVPSWSPAD